MLKIEKLSKKYVNSSFELKEFSFDVPNNSLTFILGKSGSGKSTLLNILSGLDKSYNGQIVLNNKSYSFNESEMDNYRRERIGVIFQDFKLAKSLNVRDNILLEASMAGIEISEEELLKITDSLHITHLLKRSIRFLSGGEKQRVAIARCLAKRAELILCDEPTGSLDSENSEAVFSILKEISKNTIVIVVSHNNKAAQKYADKIVEIQDGEIVASPYEGKKISSSSKPETNGAHEISSKNKKKIIWKLGLNTFKSNPLRTIIEMLTIIISLGALNYTANYLTPDKDVRLESLNNKGINYICVKKNDVFSSDGKETNLASYFEKTEISGIVNDLKINALSYAHDCNPVVNNVDLYDSEEIWNASVISVDSTFLTSFNFNLLCGTLPTNENEIALPTYVAKKVVEKGILSDGNLTRINNEQELLGKKIELSLDTDVNKFSICGVVDIPFECKNGEMFTESDFFDSFSNAFYVVEGNSHFENYGIDRVFIPMSGIDSEDKNLISNIENQRYSFPNGNDDYKETVLLICTNDFHSFREFSSMYTFENFGSNALLNILLNTSRIIFFLLSIGISLYYFSYLFSSKNDEIETLRTIGVGKKELLQSYMINAMLNAIICIVLSIFIGLVFNGLFYKLTYPTLMLDFKLRAFSPFGLLAIIAIPIVFNLLFTLLFSKTDIRKKYK